MHENCTPKPRDQFGKIYFTGDCVKRINVGGRAGKTQARQGEEQFVGVERESERETERESQY